MLFITGGDHVCVAWEAHVGGTYQVCSVSGYNQFKLSLTYTQQHTSLELNLYPISNSPLSCQCDYAKSYS